MTTYLLGPPAKLEIQRAACVWSLLKALTAEVERSRGALRTLAYNLELFTVLELANMSKGEPDSPSLLTKMNEQSVEAAKIQVRALARTPLNCVLWCVATSIAC
jgi:hypothetical protein